MRRREFITRLVGAVAAWPLAARAQQGGKIYRIGILEPVPAAIPPTLLFRADEVIE